MCNFNQDSIYKMHNTALDRQGDIMPTILICNNWYIFIENIVKCIQYYTVHRKDKGVVARLLGR